MQDTSVIGKVESLWRYPVKSMRGERLTEAFIGFSGVYGDRLFAVRNASAPKGFPYLTGREEAEMLLYHPRFRHPGRAAMPPNLTEAERIGPGLTPVYAYLEDLILDVESPSGKVLAIDDPALLEMLGKADRRTLTVQRSDRAMTDCRPISLFAVQTARQIGEEIGVDISKRRFRANIYVDLQSAAGFGEDALVGRRLRVGAKAEISILERDPRCKMISIDPDTAEQNPEVLKKISRAHEGTAGVYGAVLVEGLVRIGDYIELVTV